MHTAWMREHNRLVRQLAELNHHWNDERLFHGMSRPQDFLSSILIHIL